MSRPEVRVAIVLFSLVLALSAHAQSPREQLRRMVEQLQKAPNDDALREKIVRLAAQMEPASAIPEEARRFMVRGITLQKEAKGPSDYAAAIEEYRQALVIAPWWPDAYFNLSVAQEAAGRFREARGSLGFYLASGPAEAEARSAQDRVYALEAREQKEDRSKKEQAEAAALKAQRERLLEKWRGPWRARFCGPIQGFPGCNDAERAGTNWYTINGMSGPSAFSFEFATDGSVRLDAENFANCPSARIVQLASIGTTYHEARWEVRQQGGQGREVYGEVAADGSWLTISCDRPLSGAVPSARYHYVNFYRP